MTNVCKPFRHAASLALAASVALGAPGILAAAAAQPALALTTADAESFRVALEDDATDTVILQGDIELAQTVAIGGDKAIYLAGKTLTISADGLSTNGHTLMLWGGTLALEPGAALNVDGGMAHITSDVTVTGVGANVFNVTSGVLRVDGTLKTTAPSDDADAAATPQATINVAGGSLYVSDEATLSFAGDRWVQATDGSVTLDAVTIGGAGNVDAPLYVSNATLTLNGTHVVVSGPRAIWASGGATLNLNAASIEIAKSADASEDAADANGANDADDAADANDAAAITLDDSTLNLAGGSLVAKVADPAATADPVATAASPAPTGPAGIRAMGASTLTVSALNGAYPTVRSYGPSLDLRDQASAEIPGGSYVSTQPDAPDPSACAALRLSGEASAHITGGSFTGARHAIGIERADSEVGLRISDGSFAGATSAIYRGAYAVAPSGSIRIEGGAFESSSKTLSGDAGKTYTAGARAQVSGGTFGTDIDGSGSGGGFQIDVDDLMFVKVEDGLRCVAGGAGFYVLRNAATTDLAALWKGGSLRVTVNDRGEVVQVGRVNADNQSTAIDAANYIVRKNGSTFTITGQYACSGTFECPATPGSHAGTPPATSGAKPGSAGQQGQALSYSVAFGAQTVRYVAGEEGEAFPAGTWLDAAGNVVPDKAALDKLVKADGDVIVLTAKPDDAEPQPETDSQPENDPAPALEDGWRQTADGAWQYIRDGELVRGAWLADGGRWYLLDAAGDMVVGWWHDVRSGTWYYLGERADCLGAMQVGWTLVGGRWYLFGQDGAMLVGWQQDATSGAWYYLSERHDGSFGAMQTGWLRSNGRWYYLNPAAGGPQGAMMTGWQFVDGQWYYLSPQVGGPLGACVVDTVTPDGFRVDGNGAWVR